MYTLPILWDQGKEDLPEEAEQFFTEKGADLVERTEISLEEMFIYSNRRRGNHE